MDEGAGSRSPKTLADVSHLFFSSAAESVEEPTEVAANPVVAPSGDAGRRVTKLFVVTGGSDAPGKSTIAVNLAHSLATFGRVAVFDADPRVPNARFYLGLPSWHYLSPLTGGSAAPDVVTDAGVVVTDWSCDANGLDAGTGERELLYADVSDAGREPLDFAVVDVPTTRQKLLSDLAGRTSVYVVAARPCWSGFEHAFAALRTLRRECDADWATLVVNGSSGEDQANAFHAKIMTAAERLLSMDVHLAGTVPHEPGLGAEQRERGAIVVSRPDAAAALALRQIAANALEMTKDGSAASGGTAQRDRRED